MFLKTADIRSLLKNLGDPSCICGFVAKQEIKKAISATKALRPEVALKIISYVLEQYELFYRTLLNCNLASFLFNRKARQEKKRKGRKEKKDY
jgi:hypothetical protein